MKSIVEEASSVSKAIEKGWIQAGKPQEFSIKVFEIEQRNFFGMTTKSAKIAIFYNEKLAERTGTKHESSDRRQQSQQQQHPRKDARPQQPQRQQRNESAAPATQRQQKPEEKRDQVAREARETWSDDMVSFSQSWMKETLHLMNMDSKHFSIEVKNYYLKINFDQPLFEDAEREKLLFRSFAHLIMQSLRNKFKKGFRGFKVILNSGKA